MFDPGFLKRVSFIFTGCKSLDSDDVTPFKALYRHDARTHCNSIYHHSACAALCYAAPKFGAGQGKLFAKNPEQWLFRIGINRHHCSVQHK